MLKLKVLAGVLLPLSFMATNGYGESNTRVSISSPEYALVKKLTFLKSVEANKKLTFTVWLKLRNKDKLDRLVEEIYNPNSPNYQQYLTQEVFEKYYAPTKEVEQSIQHYFISQGMQASIVNHSLQVTAPVQQIEQTLHMNLNYYLYNDYTIYASTDLPSLEQDIAQYIVDITGLSNIPLYHPADAGTQNQERLSDFGFINDAFKPTAIPTTTSIKGFSGAQLQYTYNINNIPPVNGIHLDGKGQTLVIVDGCGANSPQQILNDANQYFGINGIKPFFLSGTSRNFAMLNQNLTPYTTVCTPINPGEYAFTGEIALDVESAHTLAPGANTVLIVADGGNPYTALQTVIAYLTTHNVTIAEFPNAYAISNSWTNPEFDPPPNPNTSLEQSLQTAAAFGISVQVSSGDCGDNTYTSARKGHNGRIKCKYKDNTSPAVSYPASSPYVTAVGATSMFVDENYNYAFENVWGTYDLKEENFVSGTTGGISKYYQAPTWQNSISTFYAGGYGHIDDAANAICGANQNQTCRAVPDISMLGDPETGLRIILNGAYLEDGGTSLASPLYSATLLLINQARALLNKSPIGQTAPYLYQMNSIFLSQRALNLIMPPVNVIDGAKKPDKTEAPSTSFELKNKHGDKDIWGWDSSLTLAPENQFWNDGVGVGSPNLPRFVPLMTNL